MATAENRQHERVAVVVVHGVADQAPGSTVRALAELLIVSSSSTEGKYEPAREERFTLGVDLLEPLQDVARQQCDGPASREAQPLEPDTPWNRLKKAWRQSWASDFERASRVVDPGKTSAEERATRQMPSLKSAGTQMTDYLLFKAIRNLSPKESYSTTRLSMRRKAAGEPGSDVHMYEMYWADLSRLSGSVPRVLTEAFTLLFRLSLLGRDTVRGALQFGSRPTSAWKRLRWTQTALDWMFSRVLAVLMLQLLMVALVIVPMGLLRPHAPLAAQLVAVALATTVFAMACYRHDALRRSFFDLVVVAAVLAVPAWLVGWHQPSAWVTGLAWLIALTMVYRSVMATVEQRFPFTSVMGWFMWGVVALIVVHGAWTTDQAQGLAIWVVGALQALEVLLAVNAILWILAPFLMVAWLLAGHMAAQDKNRDSRATVATGRFGAFLSMSFFVVVVMAAWALVSELVALGSGCLAYWPIIFNDFERQLPASQCGPLPPAPTTAAEFLHDRYNNGTEVFSLVAGIALLLVSYLVGVFLPSVLAELKVHRDSASRLGRWLSTGYRQLDRHVIGWLVWAGLVVSTLVAIYFAVAMLARLSGLDLAGQVLKTIDGYPWVMSVKKMSKDTLAPIVIGAATLTAALLALGGVLSRYLPWLRAPLDVALDVDNHFREFPRQAIPRARIFARYHALLRHVDAQHYDRVVIVAHSQGTVITAELLQYLHERAALRTGPTEAAARCVMRLAAKTQLLTLGCPLRQLYAARFPGLYDWVLPDDRTGRIGPYAGKELGVRGWVNAFTTGDYVGRWLWGASPWPDDEEAHAVPSRTDALARLSAAAECDICLGSGAHTHYFEPSETPAEEPAPDRATVAFLVDHLIGKRGH